MKITFMLGSMLNFSAFFVLAVGLCGTCSAQVSPEDVAEIKLVGINYEKFFEAFVVRCEASHPLQAPKVKSVANKWLSENHNALAELREMYPRLTRFFPEAERTGYQPTQTQMGDLLTAALIQKITESDANHIQKACLGEFEHKVLRELDFAALLNRVKKIDQLN
ncbi:MAG: hypothetical protein ABIP67_05230 [Burkholderiales bacterium]